MGQTSTATIFAGIAAVASVMAPLLLTSCSRENASTPAAADTTLQVAVPASAENADGTVPWKGCIPLLVSVVGAGGTLAQAANDTVVSLVPSGPTSYQPAGVYSDSGCKTSVTTVTIPQGSSTVTAYVMTPVKGQFAIVASASGYPAVPRLVISAN